MNEHEQKLLKKTGLSISKNMKVSKSSFNSINNVFLRLLLKINYYMLTKSINDKKHHIITN